MCDVIISSTSQPVISESCPFRLGNLPIRRGMAGTSSRKGVESARTFPELFWVRVLAPSRTSLVLIHLAGLAVLPFSTQKSQRVTDSLHFPPFPTQHGRRQGQWRACTRVVVARTTSMALTPPAIIFASVQNKRLSKGKKGLKKKVVDPFSRKGALRDEISIVRRTLLLTRVQFHLQSGMISRRRRPSRSGTLGGPSSTVRRV